VLNQCPVGIVLARGARGEHLELNARAQLLVGRPIDHVGQFPELLLTPDERPVVEVDDPTGRALRGECLESTEFLLRQADGSPTPVSISGAPILDAGGAIQGAIVAFQDISAAKQLERLRAEWSSIVAHDLRQPLSSIALQASRIVHSLARAPDGPAAVALQAATMIGRAAARLNRMIADLLDLSQLEARRVVLSRVPTDLVALLRTVLEPLGLRERAPPFQVHVAGVIPRVTVDPDRIAQVMENLLSNAMKYGAAGRPIVVEIGVAADRVGVAVMNEGPGIAPEDLPRLFCRFTRTEGATRLGVKGVGLGLYISRELVTAHGGEITAESVPGGWTTFRFTIPIEAPALRLPSRES
jgi:signal transduction histidine kinase